MMTIKITNIIKVLPYNSNPKIRYNKRKLSSINKIVVHQELSTGTLEAVNRFHITPSVENQLDSKNGAPHFAYHFGIRTNGEICQCNELDDIAWHTKMNNTSGIGIMLQGDFDAIEAKHKGKNVNPNEEQLKSLRLLLDYLISIMPKYLNKTQVYCHHELQKKPVCAGDAAMKFVEEYRNENI